MARVEKKKLSVVVTHYFVNDKVVRVIRVVRVVSAIRVVRW